MKILSKNQRLIVYRRTLKVLEELVKNNCNETRILINVNQHKSYMIHMCEGLGLCYIMSKNGVKDAYESSKYNKTLPELYKVGIKHGCDLTHAFWFKYNNAEYKPRTKKGYKARIAFMKEVIEETKNS